MRELCRTDARANVCFRDEIANQYYGTEQLRSFLMGTPEGDWISTPTSDDAWDYDDYLKVWAAKWTTLEQIDQPAHIRDLLIHGLCVVPDGDSPQYFWSSCTGFPGAWETEPNAWHCPFDKVCMEWHEWHCRRCKKYTYGLSIPWSGCDGVSDMYHKMDPNERGDVSDDIFGYGETYQESSPDLGVD